MSNTANAASRYFVPPPSHWPIVGSLALALMASGTVMAINSVSAGKFVLIAGFAVLVYMLFGWFGTVIRESEGGQYNKQVDGSFRWSMSWFIFSEVMFFAAFFGSLFYIRVLSVPDLASFDNVNLLYPHFNDVWPSAGPAFKEKFSAMEAFGLPAVNTLLLLTSGATLTWAHWGLVKENRKQLIFGLILTVALGIAFLICQAIEYHEAYTDHNLKLTTGVFGSTFFMLTGFHGFHVTLGVTMLIVILFRCMFGHFKPDHHFGFEAVAWYWHFVDVVWLLLFVLVYWL
jgi:cytochrome c oxidase subunit 3